MASDKGANWVHVVVALITVAGGITVALISTKAYTPKDVATQSTEGPSAIEPSYGVIVPSPVSITGVLIGKPSDEPFVSSVITQFAPTDEIAITVRYTASEEVSNFPVRLSARVFSGMGKGVEEQVSDISMPGKSFWTFRFKPKAGWMSSQQFVSIEVDGREAYSQALSIKHQ